MSDKRGTTLPYRSSDSDLASFIDARARGRDPQQIQALFGSTPTFQGTLLTATELGFLNEEGELTDRGRRFALEVDNRPTQLLDAILEYEPYELLLEAIFNGKEPDTTEIAWIETWWATTGYGSSQTNRSESSTVFARLVTAIGLGEYKQGRKGHATRIDWKEGSSDTIAKARSSASHESISDSSETNEPPLDGNKERVEPEKKGAFTHVLTSPPYAGKERVEPEKKGAFTHVLTSPPYAGNEEANVVHLNIGQGRKAVITLPPTLSAKEKERLLALVDLLVEVEEPKPPTPQQPESQRPPDPDLWGKV